MGRATKAKTRGKARTRRTSQEAAKSGSDEPQGHFVAEVKSVPRESRSETAESSPKPGKPHFEDELMDYLKADDVDVNLARLYSALGEYLRTCLPESFARTTALRKLVESKDAAERIRKLYFKKSQDLAWVVTYTPDDFKVSRVPAKSVSIDKQFAVAK